MKITLTRIGYFILTLLTILVLLLSLARLATPWLSKYTPQIEQYASEQLGMSVKVNEIQVGWYYIEPVIHLSNVSISVPKTTTSSEKSVIIIDDIGVGISLFSTLWHWNIEPCTLLISGASLHMNPTLLSDEPLKIDPIIHWILKQKKVLIKNVALYWNNTPSNPETTNPLIQQKPFTIANIALKLKKGFYSRYLDIQMDWLSASDTPTHFSVFTKFSGNDLNMSTWQGHFTVSVDNIHLSNWKKRIMPYLPETTQKKVSLITLTQGENSIQWSGDFSNGKISNTVELKATDLQLNMPNIFNVIFPISSIDTLFSWNNQDKKIQVNEFFIETPQISAKTNEALLTWTDEPLSLHLNSKAKFFLHDLVALKRYLPYKIMKPKLSAWLKQSIIGGKNTTGNITFNGKLSDYPFDNMTEKQGHFVVDSLWEQFSLDYKPGWPPGKSMHAHIIFKNRDLIADIDDGMIDQLPLTDIKAKILDLGLGKETLEIQGHLKTNAENARNFILDSALKKQFDSFNHMSISGPAIFDIGIEIPLYPENNNNLINGKVDFLDNEFILPEWWNLHFQHFKGELTYNQQGIVGSLIHTTLLNYPLTLKMTSVEKPQVATQVDITGKIGIDSLKKLFDVFLFDFMDGSTTYKAQLLLTPSSTDQDTLMLNTDLQGIAINLPKPYNKKAVEKQPLSLLLRFSDVMDTLLSIHYQNRVSIHLDYDRINKTYQFHRGKIHLGNIDKKPPTEDGLKVEGSLPEFILSDWLPFFKKMNQPHQTLPAKGNIVLQLLDLHIKLLNVMGDLIHNANIQLSEKNKAWNINIKSDEITGNIFIPEKIESGITAKLDSLNITSQERTMREKTQKKSNTQPKDIPPLNISVKHLQYNKISLGQMKLITKSTNNTLTLNKFNLQSPNTLMDIKGTWSMPNNQPRSQITGYISSNNIQQTLTNFGIDPIMSGKKGLVSFNLNWPNSFGQYTSASLNGLLDFKIEDGLITHLDKSAQKKVGIGQILGLLSPENLLKHLTLDFSDLSSKGLPFDKLTGKFAIHSGKMTTNNTELDSSVAYIGMKGSINLGLQTFNLLFNISPRTTSSLPVIATIAGGPIVGLATWAASTLINQGMKHADIYTYKVTGPWKKPKIISENKKK